MIQGVKTAGKKCSAAWRSRTMKREVALGLLMFWCLISYKVFWTTDVQIINALTGIYGIATPSIFAFVTAVFGFDAYAKQIKKTASEGQKP